MTQGNGVEESALGSDGAGEPLLTDEAREWIGLKRELSSGIITPEDIKRFVVATGDENPVYTSDSAAKAAGHTSVLAPPMLYLSATRPIVPRDALSEDGGSLDRRPPVGQGRAMAGQYDITFFHPIQAGDRLTGVQTLASLEEKQGRRRRFVVAVWKTEYRNQKGEIVIHETASQLLF